MWIGKSTEENTPSPVSLCNRTGPEMQRLLVRIFEEEKIGLPQGTPAQLLETHSE